MKKVLRFLLILIIILFVGYLILCATSPATMNVERSAVINGSKATIWSVITDFNNYDHYSPWKEQDSTIKSTITGTPGQPGHMSSWVSEKSGSGEMTLSSTEGNTMNYDMHFITPFEGMAKGSTILEDAEGGTKVTCTYSSEAGFFMRGANTLFTKSFMGAMFERQLELLKEYIESGKAAPVADIKETTFPATTFATIRKMVKFDEMNTFYADAYQQLGGAAGDKIAGTAYSLTYVWDEANGQADVAAAFPVSGDVAGMTMVSIPESRAYMLQHTGPYSGLYDAHMSIATYAAQHGLTEPLVIEEYVKMEPEVTDSTQFVTNIYYLYK